METNRLVFVVLFAHALLFAALTVGMTRDFAQGGSGYRPTALKRTWVAPF